MAFFSKYPFLLRLLSVNTFSWGATKIIFLKVNNWGLDPGFSKFFKTNVHCERCWSSLMTMVLGTPFKPGYLGENVSPHVISLRNQYQCKNQDAMWWNGSWASSTEINGTSLLYNFSSFATVDSSRENALRQCKWIVNAYLYLIISWVIMIDKGKNTMLINICKEEVYIKNK